MRRSCRWAAVCVGFFGAATGARGQDLTYDDSRIGQRGLGLAGAFVGVADDASAAYHNPGGLALQAAGSATGSLAVSRLQGYRVVGGYRSSLGDFDLVDDADTAIPSSVAIVARVGHATGGEPPRHALALFYGSPTIVRRRFTIDAFGDDPVSASSFSMQREDQWTYYGAAYAVRVLPAVGLGLGAFFVTRNFRHEEVESLAVGAVNDATRALVGFRRSLVTLQHWGLALRLGAAWDVAPRWRLGAMVQPPSVPFRTQVEVTENAAVRGVYQGALVDEANAGAVERAGAESPLPWQVRAGAAYQHDRDTLVSFEASLYGPTGRADDPVRFLGRPATDPDTGQAPRPGVYVAETYVAELTVQAAAGVELLLGRRVPVQLGLASLLSAAPPVPAATDTYRPDRLDGLAAAASIGFRTPNGDLAVGASGSAQWGEGLSARADRVVGGGPAYERTDASAWSVVLFITGTGRAAQAAAEEVVDQVLRPVVGRGRDEAPAADPAPPAAPDPR